MDKMKFLMTDTGAQTTQLCRQALEAKGIDVTVCEKNGSQALKSLLEEHPQAVLLDAFMPDLDAITVKQRYETQDTRGGHTTFFVTGAFQSEEVEQDLLDNGFSFFFVKFHYVINIYMILNQLFFTYNFHPKMLIHIHIPIFIFYFYQIDQKFKKI